MSMHTCEISDDKIPLLTDFFQATPHVLGDPLAGVHLNQRVECGHVFFIDEGQTNAPTCARKLLGAVFVQVAPEFCHGAAGKLKVD